MKSSYQDWIGNLRGNRYVDQKIVDRVEAFVIGGDESALSGVFSDQLEAGKYFYQPPFVSLPKPTEFSAEDHRAVRWAVVSNPSGSGFYKLSQLILSDPDADQFGPILEILEPLWDLPTILHWIDNRLLPGSFSPGLLTSTDGSYEASSVSTSLTRFVMNRSNRELIEAVNRVAELRAADSSSRSCYGLNRIPWVVFKFDRPRLRELADAWLSQREILKLSGATAFACSGDLALENRVIELSAGFHVYEQLHFAEALFVTAPERHKKRLQEAAEACLVFTNYNHVGVTQLLLRHFGIEALDLMIKHLKNLMSRGWYSTEHLNQVRKSLGELGARFFLAVFGVVDAPAARVAAVSHLIEVEGEKHASEIESQLHQLIADKDSASAIKAIQLAGRWHPERFEDDLWKALGHKGKGVREAAARSLATLGEKALDRAADSLVAKHAPVRDATVTLLSLVDSPKAGDLLEARLDEESSNDVRDHILLALEKVWRDQGRVIGLDYVEGRIAKFVKSGGGDPPAWLKVTELPPLKFQNGDPVSDDAVRYLVYRQSRAKEMVCDVEIKPLIGQIERASSGDFALAVFKAFLTSGQDAKDRWALSLSGLLGDNRLVPHFMRVIAEWPADGRHKLAEYAAQALALVGTDAALMAVDSLEIKYRSKYKNIGKAAADSFRQAAADQGITPEELGDRVVPRLGFEEGQTARLLEGGNRRIRMTIGRDLKFEFFDLDTNKPVKSLPAAIPEDVRAQIKEDTATLREVAKAQNLRLENLLVQQHEWPVDRWTNLFLNHPVLKPYGVSLIWSHGDLVFRALEDGTLTDAEDEPVALPTSGFVKMVHPLNLAEEARQNWIRHLADYEIAPPFLQLERPVQLPEDDQRDEKYYKEVDQTCLGTFTFRGRAEKLGWVRGSVCDAGGITTYYKPFPGAGADAFLYVDDMWVGMGTDDQMKMGRAFFVKHGSVSIGSYVYDEPSNEKDPRLFAFGEVPPLVYSEVISELHRIAGKTPAGTADEPES